MLSLGSQQVLELPHQEQMLGHGRGQRLRSSWCQPAALDELHHQVCFHLTSPAWAIPESLLGDQEPWSGQAPHGALEQLLKGRLTVGWPAPVLEAATTSKADTASRTLVAQVRSPRGRAARGTPNGALLKEAREAAKLNQRAAATLLGMSQAQLSKLEGSQKALTRNDLDRYLAQLADHARTERFHRLRN